MVRLLPRVFRRAGLPLWYSQGFTPRPVMTYGPSLPLGVASLAEHVDLKLRGGGLDGVDEDELLARLEAASFDGVEIFGVRMLGHDDASLSKVVDERVYVAGIARSAMAADEIARAVSEPAASAREVRRNVKGIGRMIDVGKYLIDVRSGEGAELLERAGVVGDLVPVTLRIRHTQYGTARASEAVEALFGGDVSARIVRVGLYGSPAGARAAPLDLAPLRKTPLARAVGANAPVAAGA